MPSTHYWLGTTSGNFTTGANWSDTNAPADGDTWMFDYRGVGGTGPNAGLTGNALTGFTLIIDKSYTDTIGVLSDTTGTYLTFDDGAPSANTVHIGQQSGQGSPSGSSLLMLDFTDDATTINVYDSASTSSSVYYPPILLKGSALTLNVYGGSVGVAVLPGETATLAACNVAKGTGSIEPSLYLGAGVTVTTINQSAGTVYSRSNQTTTTYNKTGGTYRYAGTGAHTTLNNYGGTVYSEGTGTIATLHNAGVFDVTRDARAKTITNCNLYDGGVIDVRTGNPLSVTFTNGIDFVRCGPQDATIRFDPHVTLTPSAV